MHGSIAKDVRKSMNLTQAEFWTVFGVTQSGGSRYESGRRIPAPVANQLYAVTNSAYRVHHFKMIRVFGRIWAANRKKAKRRK